MIRAITRSRIWLEDVKSEGEVNGRWVMEVQPSAYGEYPGGTLVSDAAPGEPDDLTFTAPNGKRYWDTEAGSFWTPRSAK